MSEEQNQQTDAESQADNGIDFGDETPVEPDQSTEEQIAEPEEKQTSEDKAEHFINQEAVNKRINEITFQKHEEKRKREELQSQLDELKAKIEKDSKKSDDIDIPDLPDIYDDDYSEKIKAREDALRKAALIEARKSILKEQEQRAIVDKLKKQQDEIAKQVEDMFESGEKHGITREDLTNADRVVSGFIRDQGIARFILSQKESAFIVKYLSNSASELEKLSTMDPLEASVHIATNITPKAMKLKPGITKTPDPIDIPKGKAAPKEDPYLKGVSFE